MFDSRATLGKIQDDLGAKNLGVLFKKNDGFRLKGHSSQPKRVSSSQSWTI